MASTPSGWWPSPGVPYFSVSCVPGLGPPAPAGKQPAPVDGLDPRSLPGPMRVFSRRDMFGPSFPMPAHTRAPVVCRQESDRHPKKGRRLRGREFQVCDISPKQSSPRQCPDKSPFISFPKRCLAEFCPSDGDTCSLQCRPSAGGGRLPDSGECRGPEDPSKRLWRTVSQPAAAVCQGHALWGVGQTGG